MIHRKLEPEVMDSAEDAREYDAMDHLAVNRDFVDGLASHLDGKTKASILDVGTGTARIPIEICRRFDSASVVALDLAPSMLELASSNVAEAGLEGRIALVLGDAKGIKYPTDNFSHVISNSIVHHLPEPLDTLREMVRVCAPGGGIFVRDLLRPSSDEELEMLVGVHARGASDYAKGLFADSLRAALTVAELRQRVASLGYAAETVQQTSDRHLTWSVLPTK